MHKNKREKPNFTDFNQHILTWLIQQAEEAGSQQQLQAPSNKILYQK